MYINKAGYIYSTSKLKLIIHNVVILQSIRFESCKVFGAVMSLITKRQGFRL